MPTPSRCRQRSRRRVAPVFLHLEQLESRCLLSAAPFAAVQPVAELENNDTLSHAQPLNLMSGLAQATGTIGNSPTGDADVDWYSFTLTQSAAVQLAAQGPLIATS